MANEEITNNQQNPTGIWQGIWAENFRNFNAIMNSKQDDKYDIAWSIMELQYSEIPPECIEDSSKIYKNTEQIMKRVFSGYTAIQRENKRRNSRYVEREALLALNSEIIKSLFRHNWINKDFSIHPRQGTATIRCPQP